VRKWITVVLVLALLFAAGSALLWRQLGQPSTSATQPPPPVAEEGRGPAPGAAVFAAEVTPLSIAPGIALAVPAGWTYVEGEALADYAAGFTGSELLLLLWQSGPGFAEAPVRASLVRIPRADLDVPGYLAELRADLAAAGLAVEPPALLSTLRADGGPVGQLTFRRVMPDGTEQLGVQYVLVDGKGADLVAISLAATAAELPAVAADWARLVSSLRLDDVS
jgi:hypothetical protein